MEDRLPPRLHEALRRIKWAFRYNWLYLKLRRAIARAPLAIHAKAEWFGGPRIGHKTAFIACYANDQVPDHVIRIADLWERHGFRANIIVATDAPFVPDAPYPVMIRENKGYDFGSWAQAISGIDFTLHSKVALVNDSIIPGPRFGELIVKAVKTSEPAVGICESRQFRRHVQSYCMIFDVWWFRMLQKKWDKVKCFERQKVIEYYELLTPSDLSIASVFPAKDMKNPTLHHWRDHADYLVKRQLIRENPYGDDLSDLPAYARS